jgi:hypothetical protein
MTGHRSSAFALVDVRHVDKAALGETGRRPRMGPPATIR